MPYGILSLVLADGLATSHCSSANTSLVMTYYASHSPSGRPHCPLPYMRSTLLPGVVVIVHETMSHSPSPK